MSNAGTNTAADSDHNEDYYQVDIYNIGRPDTYRPVAVHTEWDIASSPLSKSYLLPKQNFLIITTDWISGILPVILIKLQMKSLYI